MAEQEIPWGLVVESDHVYSQAHDRWYEVISTERLLDGVHAVIQMPSGPVQFTQPHNKEVLVRRGDTGKAVDVFIEIIRSGKGKR